MAEKKIVSHYQFDNDNDEMYERAKKEEQVITVMRKKFNLQDGRIAMQVYAKAINDKVFSTVVGYGFLEELRVNMQQSGKVSMDKLPAIPVLEKGAQGGTSLPGQATAQMKRRNEGRYRRLYEGQRLLNRRLKVMFIGLFLLLVALVIVDLKSEYSIFTYFTDYKTNMEEELINKYESWQKELEEREAALKMEGD